MITILKNSVRSILVATIILLISAGAIISDPKKAHAAENIVLNDAYIVSSTDIWIRFILQDITSIDFTKWHIDVNDGGVSPLNPVSAVVGSPWSVLTFPAGSFSDTASSYSAANGLYVDALGATDGDGDTNVVIDHSASVAINDSQVPVLTSVSIASNGANPAYAKIGDQITLTFTASEALDPAGITVEFATAVFFPIINSPVTQNTTGNTWTSTYLADSGDTEGAVSFAIYFSDMSNNAGTMVAATTDASSVTFDKTSPIISEITPVTTPTTDSTPSYTFTTDEAGTISYGGDCSSATTSAVSGSNTIAFAALANGTHSNCTITVTDTAANASNILAVTGFTIAAVVPSVTLTSDFGAVTQSSPIPITATFSSTVTGFAVGDISVTRGTAGNFTAVSGTVYTFDITPSSYGNVRVSIAAGVAEDSATNGNTASSELTVAYQQGGSSAGGNYNPNMEERPGGIQIIPVTPTPAPSSCAPYLTSNLKFGQIHGDVKKLQQFLNSHGVILAETGAGSPGNETLKFGLLTRAAVMAFQERYRADILTPQDLPSPTGHVMGYTLKKINELKCVQ